MNHVEDIKYWDKDVRIIVPKKNQEKVVPLGYILKIILSALEEEKDPKRYAYQVIPNLTYLIEGALQDIPDNLPTDAKEVEDLYKASLRMSYILSVYKTLVGTLYEKKEEMKKADA